MAAIGWYGPLIDLSRAASHLDDDFVQLIVIVRHSQPVQKHNASKGGTLLKTNIQVGDDTRSYFSVSLWQKHMGSMVVAGDVILLQNVKIVKFRNVLEATTIQISALTILVHSDDLTASKGIDELVANCPLGEKAREKLRRVIEWAQRTESTFQHVQPLVSCQKNQQRIKNWKAFDEKKLQNCLSISEVLCLAASSTANFFARIGGIFLPCSSRPDEVGKEQLFVTKRLLVMPNNKIVEDLICTGCKLCGSPMGSRFLLEQEKNTFYCPKSSKYLHDVSLIYRTFLLYVRDESGQIPLLVKNKAAEILFGNITAENVYKCYQDEQKNQICYRVHDCELHHCKLPSFHPKVSGSVGLTHGNQQPICAMQTEGSSGIKKINFHRIWLILLKALLQQGENSPFRFEIAVDREKDPENGRFELVSFAMPCYKTGRS